MDWKLNESTVVQPDLFVACLYFKNIKYISQPPVLVVELLSPSTRDKDLIVKRAIYCLQGVKYYVIVDPDNDTYQILQLEGKDYMEAQKKITAHSLFNWLMTVRLKLISGKSGNRFSLCGKVIC